MAGNVLGALLVKLGLDAAEFTSGLTKAQYQAQRFGRDVRSELDSIRSSIRGIAGVVGGLYIVDVFLENARAIIAEAEALNDLADVTGASVEQLSALKNQAYIAGADVGTLNTALSKLAAGMAGTDEETTKAKDALKALGITTRDPAQAFQEIAAKLATYEDGVNKVGIAVALFGKTGASLLPVLKDIAELQDVGATVTKQQADAAENLGKEYRRLTVEATAFKDILLSGVVPALADALKAFRVAQGQGVGFFQSLDFAMRGKGEIAENIATIERNIASLQDRLAAYKATTSSSKPAFASEVAAMTAEIDNAKRALAALNAIRGPMENDFGPPVLNGQAPSGFGKEPRSSAAAKERISDAERYLQSLKDQVEKTLDLTAAEQVLREVQDGRLSAATHAQIDQALAYAQEIDAAKEAKRAADELKKAQDEINKAREQALEVQRRSEEGARRDLDSILQSNEALKEQYIRLVGGQEALDAYTMQKLEAAAAEKEHMAAMLGGVGASEDLVRSYRAQADALRDQARGIAAMGMAERAAKDAKAIADLQSEAFDIGARAIDDLIVNGRKGSDVLKQLERDIVAFMTRQSLLAIKNAMIPGQAGAGQDLWSMLFKVGLSAIAGGSGGTPAVDVPGSFTGPQFGGYAGGTRSAGSGFAWVGENGPELVNFDGGERVYSNPDSMGMLGSTSIHQTINVLPGANSQSARQAAAQLRDATMWAVRDR